MIKTEQLKYYILSAIAISVLSLALSVVNLRQQAGRYQFREATGCMIVADSKTGRIFSRRMADILRACTGGKTACFDKGVDQSISQQERNGIVPLNIAEFRRQYPGTYEEWKSSNYLNIGEFRRQYPGYDDLTDLQLAHALHTKYFKDISFNEFAKRFGVETD